MKYACKILSPVLKKNSFLNRENFVATCPFQKRSKTRIINRAKSNKTFKPFATYNLYNFLISFHLIRVISSPFAPSLSSSLDNSSSFVRPKKITLSLTEHPEKARIRAGSVEWPPVFNNRFPCPCSNVSLIERPDFADCFNYTM